MSSPAFKLQDHNNNNQCKERSIEVPQVVEHLPSKGEDLGSTPVLPKKKKKSLNLQQEVSLPMSITVL
jgi:hypothetical protein